MKRVKKMALSQIIKSLCMIALMVIPGFIFGKIKKNFKIIYMNCVRKNSEAWKDWQ